MRGGSTAGQRSARLLRLALWLALFVAAGASPADDRPARGEVAPAGRERLDFIAGIRWDERSTDSLGQPAQRAPIAPADSAPASRWAT
jgi:hypothetical protein